MCDNCCTPFIEGEGCSSALQKKASNVASGDYSIATGHGTISSNEGELSAGTYNRSNPDQLFSVGIGTSDSNRMNAIQVNKDGSTSFLYNGQLVKLSELIHNVSPSNEIILDVQDGYIVVSYNGGTSYSPLIALSELKGDPGDPGQPGSGVSSVTASIGPTTGDTPSVTATFNNGVLNFVFSNLGGAYQLPAATSNALGGIKVGYQQNGRNFPVELAPSTHKAFVYVPGGGGGDGQNGGYYEQIFTATAQGASAPTLPDTGASIDDEGTWKHFVDDSAATTQFGANYEVWMAIRWVSGSGTAGEWRGPWNLTGAPGEDGTDIEFIYTRTADESEPDPARPLSSDTKNSSSPATTFQDDDWYPVGWNDNPQGVTSSIRLEWMSFRTKDNGVWSEFSTPVVWSAYGRQGIDGDGIEYIFATGTTAPTGNADPSQWFSDAGYQTTREYIRSDYSGVWHDNPVNINSAAPGTIQWVSIRKKYADAIAHETYGLDPYWHAYSSPVFWNNKAADGVASGITINLAPDMLYVPCDPSTGVISASFTGSTEVSVWYAGDEVSATIGTLEVKDTKPIPTDYSSYNWASASGNTVTLSIPSSSELDFSSTQLLVTIPISCTINSNPVSIDAVLTVVGSALGTSSVTYSIQTNASVVRTLDGNYSPASIDVAVIEYDGDSAPVKYTPVADVVAGTDALPSPLSVTYIIDHGTESESQEVNMATAGTNSISTTGVEDNILIRLKYNSLVIRQEQIPIIEVPMTPYVQSTLKSVVFKRSDTQPTTPGNGTNKYKWYKMINGEKTYWNDPFNMPTPDYTQEEDPTYGGVYNDIICDPIPYGWSDGVPAYDSSKTPEQNGLWMTTRIFTSNGEYPQQANWTIPARENEVDGFDFEFAMGENRPNPPTTENRHKDAYPYGYSGQIWYDPEKDKYDDVNHLRDFAVMTWMAYREVHNGSGTSWTVVRIKGEKGDTGIAGKDALPLRIRNWNELYAASQDNALTGDNKVFSGYEDDAPFRDVIIVTPQDYPVGTPCPFEENNVTTPALLVVNYSESHSTGYATLGLPGVPPVADLVIPYGTTGQKNWTSVLYQDKDASEEAMSDFGFQWSVFTNLGAVYAQILVATQGYIGTLTVNQLLAQNANIAGFVFRNGGLYSLDETPEGEANLILDGTNGELRANDVYIRGHVEAVEGIIGPFTVGYDTEGDFDYLQSIHTDVIPTTGAGNFNRRTELNLDERGLEVYQKQTSANDSSVYCSGRVKVGLSASGNGFVDINCDQTTEEPYDGAPHYDCGVKITAANSANAVEVNGNMILNGEFLGSILQPVVTIDSVAHSTLVYILSSAEIPSSSKFVIDKQDMDVVLLPDPANGYYLEILTGYDCVFESSGGNTIRALNTFSSAGTTSATLYAGHYYRFVFVKTGSVSANNFWLLY